METCLCLSHAGEGSPQLGTGRPHLCLLARTWSRLPQQGTLAQGSCGLCQGHTCIPASRARKEEGRAPPQGRFLQVAHATSSRPELGRAHREACTFLGGGAGSLRGTCWWRKGRASRDRRQPLPHLGLSPPPLDQPSLFAPLCKRSSELCVQPCPLFCSAGGTSHSPTPSLLTSGEQ